MSYNNVGRVWTINSFPDYLKTIKPPAWARAVCLHHTASPNLAQRPKGFSAQHIENLKSYYQSLGWKSGPQLFTDDDQIFGMTPLTETGVHAVSFNRSAIGIEALGYYSKGGEDPKSGRGLQVWLTTFAATKALLDWLGLEANEKTVLFHRDDPKTQKDCPGSQISKEWVLNHIKNPDLSENKVIRTVEAGGPKVVIAGNYESVAFWAHKKGYSDADIKKNLRREGNNFFWLQDHLEKAYYDKTLETTMAPVSELENIPAKNP